MGNTCYREKENHNLKRPPMLHQVDTFFELKKSLNRFEMFNPKEKYDLIKSLKTSEYKTTLLVTHRESKQITVLKEYNKNQRNLCKNCLREYKILISLDHSDIVKPKEIFENRENIYIAYEYFPHLKSFKSLILSKKNSEEIISRLIFQLFSIIVFLDQNNIRFDNFKLESLFVKKEKGILPTLKICSINVLENKSSKSINYSDFLDTLNSAFLIIALLKGDVDIFLRKSDFDIDIETEFPNISIELKILLNKMLIKVNELRIGVEEALCDNWFVKFNLISKEKVLNKKITNESMKNIKLYKAQSIFHKICLSYILESNCIDDEEINEINKIYYELDANNDGQIEFQEFYNGYLRVNRKFGKLPDFKLLNNLKQIYENIDDDGNHKIDKKEFLRACIPKDKVFNEKNLKKAFKYFDNDDSGRINFEEMYKILNKNSSTDIQMEIVHQIFKSIDSDNSKEIGFEEFEDALLKNIE